MERNIRLVLAYDGTDFHGWQKQPNLRTIQEDVERAVRRVAREPIQLIGSGRTDAGVHASGQVANFLTTCPIPCDALRRAIGGRLPKDISVLQVREVPVDFKCSADAVSKLYRYRIYNDLYRPVELHLQRYVYHVWHMLDAERMRAAGRHLVGEHDFIALATTGRDYESTIRRIFRLEVHRRYNELFIDVEGSGFLYNQVRNIVGTLIEIGRGHWEPDIILDILASRDRSRAGPTAPARGLCLQWVRYDIADFCDAERARQTAESAAVAASNSPSAEPAP
jgi:tRNA pseudouridine38-40 synthase